MMGGALGLAALASIAAARTAALGGATSMLALTDGYHAAFVVGAFFAIAAGLLSLLLRESGRAPDPANVVAEPSA